ncbi:MAG: adenylyltransferase/cytidyltransferase family protein [Candidatus Taylorbacteria bacterium]|nr:adenylyltransferase/cytidyltransferase family protein [Candidatus Taylorbacteria bacterium]
MVIKRQKIMEKKGNGTKTTIKHILSSGTNISQRFVPDYNDLERIVKTFKEMGYKVVLTQGVYDLIHEGHATYLETAKSQGDILIVGVDSDALTKKRKGPDRPIVPQEERLKMLVHLRHVDIVTLREPDHDIGYLIKTVRPDVLVVSKSTTDFTSDMAREYVPFCGSIISLPPQGTATTSARIRNLTIGGAEKLAQEVSQITKRFLDKIRQKK